MKIDLHVHSAFSKRPANWVLQKIGTAESYTSPECLYQIAKQRGMDAVTITDHNTIDGCLEIAHLPNTFISSEVTSYFPDDQCKIHVLVYRITEQQFQQIDQARENIFDLVRYLREEGIRHALAHPFYNVNDRLTLHHFEQCILLFDYFELNGNQDESVNRILQELLSQMTEKNIEELQHRYAIDPAGEDPWIKAFVGGSDDHGSLHIARTYTECADAGSVAEFWEDVADKKTVVKFCRPSTPKTMAHEMYGVAYQFYNHRFGISQNQNRSMLIAFLDRMLQAKERKAGGLLQKLRFRWDQKTNDKADKKTMGLMGLFQSEALQFIVADPQLVAVLENNSIQGYENDDLWFRFVNRISNQTLAHLGGRLLDNIQHVNPFDFFHILGSAGALYTLMAPYFVSYCIYSGNRHFANIADQTMANHPEEMIPNIAVFTDTLHEINGVALTLQKNIRLANQFGKHMQILTCRNRGMEPLPIPGIAYFTPVHEHDLPEYPEMKLSIPPLLEILDYCYRNKFTHIHSSTLGPVGLCGVAVARLLNLPLVTTHHTAMPQYAGYLTGDQSIEDFMWRIMVWFYNQADLVFSPSNYMTEELIQKGVEKQKIHLMPRGVSCQWLRREKLSKRQKLPNGFKFIYVGRVSKEKNLDLLAKAFKKLSQIHPDAVLVIVGDGPYLEQMKSDMNDVNGVFTGYLQGDLLRSAYLGSDVFVFPSTTDTFGNVVLEAQACGLPVIVTDMGGPQENILPDQTGFIVKGNEETALLIAMCRCIENRELSRQMGLKARQYAQTRDYDQAFLKYFEFYNKLCPVSSKMPSGGGTTGWTHFPFSSLSSVGFDFRV